MSKALKIILGIVAIFVIFMITAVILITVFVDPNNYKDQITATVKDKTGRNLTIGGNIELSFFPWLGLELGPTELSNAPGFGKEPFVKVSNATIRVKVLPLFKGDVEMNKLILDGLALNLMKNRAGQTNWQDLARKPSSKDKPPKTAEKAPTPKESKPAPPIL
ncbi:MAG: AsmA family protein, partial [Candidatus Binatia bacterium]